MVVVFVSVFQEEALVVKSLLESAGLEPALLSEGMLDVTPIFAQSVTGLRVCVPDEEAEDAKALVEDYRSRRKGASLSKQ